MSEKILVPVLGESITEATVAKWLKNKGDSVESDEPIVELETDKVNLEVPSPIDGVLTEIASKDGAVVEVGALLGSISQGSSKPIEKQEPKKVEEKRKENNVVNLETERKAPKIFEENNTTKEAKQEVEIENQNENISDRNGPAVKKLLKEHDLNPNDIASSGKGGRVTKADVINHLDQPSEDIIQEEVEQHSANQAQANSFERIEERVPMSRLRSTIANRLLTVKQETAMLTTFNEVDMLPIKELRAKYGQEFEKQHGIKLGFMGFFIIAAVQALKKFPIVNASIDGSDVIYHGYQDIGVAVSTERGLVVPIIKDADTKSLPELEKSILEYSEKARDSKLTIEEMQGGTFTISNGGVFGSLLSTPILNAPQTAILGMHSIQDRPVAINGEVVIRPMMYLAMSYDHRLLDGKEAVRFLVSIKEQLESPERLLLNL